MICPIECGNLSSARAATSAEISSTHATGSACAPLPRSSSVSARSDIWFAHRASALVILGAAKDPCTLPTRAHLHKSVAINPSHRNERSLRMTSSRLSTQGSGLGEVLLFQNSPVMQFVPGDRVRDRPHRHFALIGYSTPHPRRFVQIAQQRQRRPPHRNVVLD